MCGPTGTNGEAWTPRPKEEHALMLGMVLAAGAGRRLRRYTDRLPKALVPVDGAPTIMDITLSDMAASGLTDVVVVVGYCAKAVEERKEELEERHGVELTHSYNDKAEEWNSAYSLWTAREFFSEGVLLVNGDTVHPVSVEETLLAARGPELLLAVDDVKNLADEEMKVTLDDNGHLKKITKLMDPATAVGEYIGATLIEGSLDARLADALKATWERDPQLYYEDGYQELVNRGEKVAVAPIGKVDWVE